MSVQLPNGVIVSIGTAVDAPKTITAISNANPAVAQSAAHGFNDGDIILVKSGWQRINERLFRVANKTTGDFAIAGADTTRTAVFPTGTSAGSAAKVNAWTQITQILETSTSGGEMQFANYSFLEQDFESQIPTQHSAQSMTFSIADDPSLAGFIALEKASELRDPVPLRITMPNGSIILYYGYVSLNTTPSMTKNQVMACNATFSLMSRPMRYAS